MITPARSFVQLPRMHPEYQSEQREEQTGDLQSENAGRMRERPPQRRAEASCPARQPPAALRERCAGGNLHRCGCRLRSTRDRPPSPGSRRSRRPIRSRRCLGRPLAQLFRCYTRANAQQPADAIRLHAESLAAPPKPPPDSHCPVRTSEDKVRKSARAQFPELRRRGIEVPT